MLATVLQHLQQRGDVRHWQQIDFIDRLIQAVIHIHDRTDRDFRTGSRLHHRRHRHMFSPQGGEQNIGDARLPAVVNPIFTGAATAGN